jgi:hypothetical protein
MSPSQRPKYLYYPDICSFYRRIGAMMSVTGRVVNQHSASLTVALFPLLSMTCDLETS